MTRAAAAGTAETPPDAPDAFLCSITHDVMCDPVVAADGFTYERAQIQEWLAKKLTSPKTGEALESAAVFPNHNLRSQIREWQEKR